MQIADSNLPVLKEALELYSSQLNAWLQGVDYDTKDQDEYKMIQDYLTEKKKTRKLLSKVTSRLNMDVL